MDKITVEMLLGKGVTDDDLFRFTTVFPDGADVNKKNIDFIMKSEIMKADEIVNLLSEKDRKVYYDYCEKLSTQLVWVKFPNKKKMNESIEKFYQMREDKLIELLKETQ